MIKDNKNKKLVFISYSHKESKWKDMLVDYLTLYQQENYFDIWVDDKIRGGEEWEKEIYDAITNADIAILLISNSFLISKFIREKELPLIQDEVKRGLVIYPIIASDCDWSEWECFSKIQCRFHDKPLDKLSQPELATALKQSALEIKAIIQKKVSKIQKKVSKPKKNIYTPPLPTPFLPGLKNIPQWLEASLFVFILLSMCIMTLTITYHYFPEYVSNITFQKQAFTVSGAAAFILFIIILFKILSGTALTYLKIKNEMKILVIFISVLPLCSIFSITASAYMLDISVMEIVYKIISKETNDVPIKNDDDLSNDETNNIDDLEDSDTINDKSSLTKHLEKKDAFDNQTIENQNNEIKTKSFFKPEDKKKEIVPKKNLSHPKNSEIIKNKFDMTFVLIHAGSFMMGSPDDDPMKFSNEVLHKVTLTENFYMQATEVTQGQWIAVMGNNPSRFKSCGEKCPVENISWNDAKHFIKKLNEMDNTAGLYRLPTEAEWEFAARAGTTTRYSWGNEADCSKANYGCFSECKNQNPCKTMKVGSLQSNMWGLFDMHGNVWEWCEDSYIETLSDAVDPLINQKAGSRVVRGGGWSSDAGDCRSAGRYWGEPGFRYGLLGVRLVFSRGQ